MLSRLQARIAGTDQRTATLAALRAQHVVGILTLTGDPDWDARLNRNMRLPAGVHLWAIDRPASTTADGQMMLRVRATLLNEPIQRNDSALAWPSADSLLLLADSNEVHTWHLTDLLQRADDGDEQAATDLHELELHVQQLALAAAMEGFEPADSMRWPGDG